MGGPIPFEWFALGFGIGCGVMFVALAMIVVIELVKAIRRRGGEA